MTDDSGITPNTEENTPVMQRRLGEFGESEAAATVMLLAAFKALKQDSRYKRLSEEQADTCTDMLTRDLYGKYRAGEMDSWEPPVDELLDMMTEFH
jgi:hypothetical protein